MQIWFYVTNRSVRAKRHSHTKARAHFQFEEEQKCVYSNGNKLRHLSASIDAADDDDDAMRVIRFWNFARRERSPPPNEEKGKLYEFGKSSIY